MHASRCVSMMLFLGHGTLKDRRPKPFGISGCLKLSFLARYVFFSHGLSIEASGASATGFDVMRDVFGFAFGRCLLKSQAC